jgi:hypothetical protein
LGHFDLQSIGILADSSEAVGTHAPWRFQPMPPAGKTRNQLHAIRLPTPTIRALSRQTALSIAAKVGIYIKKC